MNLSLEQAQSIIYNSYIYKTFYSGKQITYCSESSNIGNYYCGDEYGDFHCQIDTFHSSNTIVIRFDNNRSREIYSGKSEDGKNELTVDYISDNQRVYFSVWRWEDDHYIVMRTNSFSNFFSRNRRSSVLDTIITRKLEL